MNLGTITFHGVMLFVHIAAAVIAFGVTFAYPLMYPFVRSHEPRMVPLLHRVQNRIGVALITPAATILLAAGIYLAADNNQFSKPWVGAGVAIIVVLLGLGGAFFAPHERRAAELAERDVGGAAPGAAVVFSAEYEAVARRIALVGAFSSLLVLVAIFLMVTKPGS
jgi:hypothetical protein